MTARFYRVIARGWTEEQLLREHYDFQLFCSEEWVRQIADCYKQHLDHLFPFRLLKITCLDTAGRLLLREDNRLDNGWSDSRRRTFDWNSPINMAYTPTTYSTGVYATPLYASNRTTNYISTSGYGSY